MTSTIKSLFLFALLINVGCKEEQKNKKSTAESETTEVENTLIPNSWINQRVEKAKTRLLKSEAGKIVWEAMEAHGGLAKWYGNGALHFRFDYQPLDGSTQRDSYQTIDTWSNRARHTSAEDSTAHFGWTGKKAWVMAKDSTAFAYDTKFWALTPIYFLGQPFILDGQGVNLELLPQQVYQEKNNDVVKVTFNAGTGDAPDDYYILYFDAESHQLKVIRYIVSYPEYFKKGEHLPEKFMDLSEFQTVDGIVFPTKYKTHWLLKNEKPGPQITKINVSDIQFVKDTGINFFDVPAGAKILD